MKPDAFEVEGGDPRRHLRGDEPLDVGERPRGREALDQRLELAAVAVVEGAAQRWAAAAASAISAGTA